MAQDSSPVSPLGNAGPGKAWASLRLPGFRLLYAGNTFAAVDMNVRMAVHGWLVLELSNDSELWVGVYALLMGMGQFVFSIVAGALVDRFQRRNVVLAEVAASAVLAFVLALGILSGVVTLWMAIVVAPVMGCMRAVRFTAMNRFIYDLVGPRQLVNGVSLWRLSAAPMMVFGAILAGWLIEFQGIWAAYAFMAGSLATATPFLLFIRVKGDVAPAGGNLFRQMAEGVRYAVAVNPHLRTLFTISIVMETLGFAFLIMIPVVAKNVLETGGTGLGFLQAGVGAGMLLGTLVMARTGDSQRKPRIIFVNALAAGVALMAFALSRSLPLSVALAAAVMGFLNAYDLTLGAMMQLVAPRELRGRAVSLHSLAISFTALGGFVMGAAASVVGAPAVLVASGAGIVVNSLLRRPALLQVREHAPDQRGVP